LKSHDQELASGMSLFSFCEWLANTAWSTTLHESSWGYSLIESVHVLTLCLFLGTVVMLDLRLLGWTMRRTPVSEVMKQFMPWTVTGFVIMVISGLLLFSAIPVRTYQSIFFRGKLLMLVLAGINVWLFHSTVYRNLAAWDLDAVPPKRARIAGCLSLILWGGIVITGRMIAYNWFDCDRQPQPAIVNILAGCRPDSQ
jgi:hypothetical protein